MSSKGKKPDDKPEAAPGIEAVQFHPEADRPGVMNWVARPEQAAAFVEAYGEATGGKNYQGRPMPPWDELPEAIRHAWDAAVQAVLRQTAGEPDHAEPSDEERIRDAMAEAQDHPGRTITR